MTAGPLPEGRQRRRHELVPPEGVPLGVALGDLGERLLAFTIDMAIVHGVILVALVLLGLTLFAGLEGGWTTAFVLLGSFALRNFYFIFFELSWQGSTPGKRALGLRVVDRRGGPLRPDAVIARNLMRDVEVSIPISWIAVAEETGGGWLSVLGLGWVLILLLMPLLNHARMRVGDLVAGTVVVHVPKRALLDDVSASSADMQRPRPAAATGYAFTELQLRAYGIYELQVLERLLREDGGAAGVRALDEVSRRIRRKIDWRGEVGSSRQFLDAFYAALREHLEQRMLLGKRREDKHAKES